MASSSSSLGDGYGWGPSTSRAETAEDRDDDERLRDVEAGVRLLFKTVGNLRAEQSEIAAELGLLTAEVTKMQTWTAWFGRFHTWASQCIRSFPWQ
jgi:hypothetical protein